MESDDNQSNFTKDNEAMELLEEKYRPVKYSTNQFHPPKPMIQLEKDVEKPLDLFCLEQNRKKIMEIMMGTGSSQSRGRFNKEVFHKLKEDNIEKIKKDFLKQNEEKR